MVLWSVQENIDCTHYCIHSQALACKHIPLKLANKNFKYYETKLCDSDLFRAHCEAFGSLYVSVLVNIELTWLSHSKLV